MRYAHTDSGGMLGLFRRGKRSALMASGVETNSSLRVRKRKTNTSQKTYSTFSHESAAPVIKRKSAVPALSRKVRSSGGAIFRRFLFTVLVLVTQFTHQNRMSLARVSGIKTTQPTR